MSFFNRFFKKDNSKKVNKPKQSKFLPPKKAVIEERFISKFVNNGGKFLYCETYSEIKYNFDQILNENGWLENDVLLLNKNVIKDYELQIKPSSNLNNSKCFITDCENLIASDGSILISSNQILEKKIDEFPNNFIVITDTTKLKNTLSEGLSEIKSRKEKIPSNITSIKNFNSAQTNVNFLSHGRTMKNLYLLMLEKGIN